MKKTLVCANTVDKYIDSSSETIYVNDSLILTPSAKDELAARGITIVYETCPTSKPCSAGKGTIDIPSCCTENLRIEKFFYAIAATLQAEYGITDPETLKTLSCQILKTIKETI